METFREFEAASFRWRDGRVILHPGRFWGVTVYVSIFGRERIGPDTYLLSITNF